MIEIDCSLPVSIKAGKSIVVTVAFIIPGTIFPSVLSGQKSFLLETMAVAGIDPDLLTLTQTVPTARSLVYGFGTIGTRHGIKFSTKENGATVTFSSSGNAEGRLSITNAGVVFLDGGGSTGSLKISGPGGLVTNDVNIIGPIPLIAPEMNFNGGSLGYNGTPGKIVVGNMTGSAIIMNDTTKTAVNITGGIFTNSSIESAAPIGTLNLKSFVNTTGASTIFAPSLGKLIDAGNLNANMAIASSIGTLQVSGDVANSTVLAGASFGTNEALGGGDDTFNAGTIGTIKIGGSLNGSLIAAGLQSNGDKFPITNNVTLLAGSKISTIVIRGTMNASRVLSIAEPPRVSIDRVVVTVAPTDSRFNLVAD